MAYAKRAIKSMFELKPNAPMPSFKAAELDLTLKELSYQMNERPVSYLAKEGKFLNANMFIMPSYDQDNESNSTLNERYKSLTDRKKRMNEILEDAMTHHALYGQWHTKTIALKLFKDLDHLC